MPICCMCHEDKPASEFAFRSIATGQLQSHCRACHAAYRRQHYLDNKETYIENERVRVGRHRERNRRLLVSYLLEHPCIDCGERDPVVLDLDHREPSLKRLEVTGLAARKPWPVVLAEIAKCDVRCASCHRKRTAQQFAWRRATWTPATNGDAISEALPSSRSPAIEQLTLEVRECRTCHVLQPITEFALKNRTTGARAWKCKACQRSYARSHYAANRPEYLEKAARRNRGERDRYARLISEYLRDHPCVDCGETDIRVLEFDHRDGSEKVDTINALIRSFNWRGLLAEIPKCDVRCANCHRRRTARQFGWQRLKLSQDTSAA